MGTSSGVDRSFLREAYVPTDGHSWGVFRIAQVVWQAASRNRQRQSRYSVFRFISDGCLDVLDNGQAVKTASSGHLVLHPIGPGYRIHVPGPSPARIWLLALHGDPPGFADRLVTPAANPAECHHLLEALISRAEEGDPDCPAACRAIASQLLDHAWRSQAPRQAVADPAFARCRRLLQEQLDQPLDLQTVAATIGVNRSTIHRWFTTQLGLSPAAYRQQLRLQQAAHLLTAGESVQQVAARVGFTCPFAFSKAFKRRFGMPPSRFA